MLINSRIVGNPGVSRSQPGEMVVPPDLLQIVEGIGGGGRTRTYDPWSMRRTFLGFNRLHSDEVT
jgi:hypothetical protein